MAYSEFFPPWWDREIDEQTGRPLRADVREAAHRVWRWVCLKTHELLGDTGDAAEVLESSVRSVSRYLDKNGVPLRSADPGGLLVLASYRFLRRLARRRRRLVPVGDSSDLAELLRTPDWRDEIDQRLFLEELARELDVKSRAVLRLRMSGYDWEEIARMLQTTAPTSRKAFWRGVRKAYLRLFGPTKAIRRGEW